MRKISHREKILQTVNLFLCFSLLSLAPAVVYSETAEQVLKKISALSASERKAVLEAGAKDEGRLGFYTSISSGDHPKIMAAFKNRYPFLETNTFRSTPARLFTRLDTEAKAGRFAVDVLGTSPVQIWLVKEKKLSIPYRSPELTAFPEKSYDPEGFWASYDVTPLILAYNSTLVKPEDVPTTNQELLDPRWKGRMSLGTDEYEWFAVMLESMGKDKGLAFMQSLAKQDLKLPGSSSRLRVQLMMAGEGSMAIAARARRVVEFKEMGAPVDLRILEPYPALPGVLTLMRHAPHPYAAILFFDWLLSAEGQTAMSQAPRIALRKGVKHIPRHEQLFAKEFFFVSPSFLAPNLNNIIKLYNKTFEIYGSQ